MNCLKCPILPHCRADFMIAKWHRLAAVIMWLLVGISGLFHWGWKHPTKDRLLAHWSLYVGEELCWTLKDWLHPDGYISIVCLLSTWRWSNQQIGLHTMPFNYIVEYGVNFPVSKLFGIVNKRLFDGLVPCQDNHLLCAQVYRKYRSIFLSQLERQEINVKKLWQ